MVRGEQTKITATGGMCAWLCYLRAEMRHAMSIWFKFRGAVSEMHPRAWLKHIRLVDGVYIKTYRCVSLSIRRAVLLLWAPIAFRSKKCGEGWNSRMICVMYEAAE
jgi:hypothetical protein